YVPSGIVLAVVDPGVGTARRPIAVSVGGGRGVLIGPDNGLLSMGVALAGGADAAVVLNNVEHHLAAPGATFAGRDIFAPAAAHLCNGVALGDLGEAIDPALLLPGVVPLSRTENGALVAEVTWVDRYGNCQLNIGPDEVAGFGEQLNVEIAPVTGERVVRSMRVVRAFAEIGGGVGLVVDSFGMLAVCVDRGSAAAELSLAAGDSVHISASPEGSSSATGVTTSVTLRR
ncbi:MAG: hypothetical protein EBY98_05155, partial [Acidimicrobiia bacterium]|nr:hypothetical protein [Acidimicrobiia bacterium]